MYILYMDIMIPWSNDLRVQGHPQWEYRLWTDEDAAVILQHHPGLLQALPISL